MEMVSFAMEMVSSVDNKTSFGCQMVSWVSNTMPLTPEIVSSRTKEVASIASTLSCASNEITSFSNSIRSEPEMIASDPSKVSSDLNELRLLHRHGHRCGELQRVHHLTCTFRNRDDFLEQLDIVARGRYCHRKLREPLGRAIERAGHIDLDDADSSLASADGRKQMACEAAAQSDQLIFASDRPLVGTSFVCRT